MLRFSLALGASIALFSQTAQAQTAPLPAVELVGEFVVEAFGGDEVAELTFEDGDTQTLHAGQGGTLAVGALVRPLRTVPVSLRGTVGYKFVLNASSNADIRLTRIPVELVAAYDITPDVWAGAGYVLHANTTLYGDGFFPDLDFDPAHGVTVEAGWKWIGASYTAISYTDELGDDYDASSVGITLRYGIPVR